MVAAFQQMRRGNDPVRPRDDLDYSANFLYMLNEQEPDPLLASIFDTCLTLHAEHTINASTFSAMVTASTLTDPYGVIASAVGTLAGPLHGGANEEVIDMLEQIGSVQNVRPFVEKCVANKDKIMGFGHRVYKVKDPRATILQRLAEQLFENFGRDDYYDIAVELEEVVEEKLTALLKYIRGLTVLLILRSRTGTHPIAQLSTQICKWREELFCFREVLN
jgi:citrate synthase